MNIVRAYWEAIFHSLTYKLINVITLDTRGYITKVRNRAKSCQTNLGTETASALIFFLYAITINNTKLQLPGLEKNKSEPFFL